MKCEDVRLNRAVKSALESDFSMTDDKLDELLSQANALWHDRRVRLRRIWLSSLMSAAALMVAAVGIVCNCDIIRSDRLSGERMIMAIELLNEFDGGEAIETEGKSPEEVLIAWQNSISGEDDGDPDEDWL